MKNFVFFNTSNIHSLITIREGETKFGEKVLVKNESEDLDEFLATSKSKFVIYGINESIGVVANYGRPGTHTSFEQATKSLLNIQHNKLCKGSWTTLLGYFDFSELHNEMNQMDLTIDENRKNLNLWVSEIDKQVTFLNSKIIQAGKIPIIIGGGHNNSYGNIKGLSLAKNKAINVVNFDAHTDFRALEGRHSGNGFSYAFDQDFLSKYFIFGIHENYTSKYQFNKLNENQDRIQYATFEEMEIRCKKDFRLEIRRAKDFVKNAPYGIEIDLDAIENVASSAITSSGYQTKDVRFFTHQLGSHANASYLHICESAPILDHQSPSIIGKLIAYLITDFIKAKKSLE